MKKTKLYSFVLLLLLLVAVGCNRDTEMVPPAETAVGMGKITGQVFSKNGMKQIGGALIFTYDKKGKVFATYSTSDGNFSLAVPEGENKIYIQTGGGGNFRSEVTVNVNNKETLALTANQTKLNQVANMAYVEGTYDQIEDIIVSLGYTATQISYSDLGSLSTISQYDIIFLNCGSKPADSTNDTAVYNNLAAFVSNGGSLYASDWAVAYLTGGGSNSTSCNMPGGFIPDTKLCSSNNGSVGIVPATVSNANLATAMGFNQFNLNFDLGSWQKINTYDPAFWDVLVSSTANPAEALMLKTDKFFFPNSPNVPIGNNPTAGWVTICHLQDGVYYTISVLQADLPMFLGIGATVGACGSASANNGKIFYTTFHNHATANIGNSELILQYVITNL